MTHDYGYLRKTKGVDGDHVDVFIGPDHKAQHVYVVHTRRAPEFKTFDEDKAFLDFSSQDHARLAFLANYDDSRHFGSMDTLTVGDFIDKVLATRERPKSITADALKKKSQTVGTTFSPVFQDRVGDNGNCFEACLASLFEVSLHDIPDFPTHDEPEFEKELADWLSKQDLAYTRTDPDDTMFNTDTYHIIEGISPRGGPHACVGLNGRIIHDPHPAGGGLDKIERWGFLGTTSEASDEFREGDHPREKSGEGAGQFTSGGGGGSSAEKESSQPVLMHGTRYENAMQILKNGFSPGEGGYVYATPNKKIAVEYGWGKLVREVEGEAEDAKFAVVVFKQNVQGFHVDNPRPSSDRWQWTRKGSVPASDIDRVEVYSAWRKDSPPIDVLRNTATDSEKELYAVCLIGPSSAQDSKPSLLRRTVDALSKLFDEWKEEEHPREKSGPGGGQFTKGSGGGAAPSTTGSKSGEHGYAELYKSQESLHATLNDEEKGAIFFWSGPGYSLYRSYISDSPEKWADGFSDPDDAIRQGKHMEHRIKTLDGAIDRAVISQDTELHRGVAFPLKVGDTFSDKSYAAFSGNREWAEKIAKDYGTKTVSVITVKFPKGSKALALPDSESYEYGKEQEVLAPRNLKFKITGVRESNGTNYYTAEIQ
jgi:hypothetical protein